MDEENNVTSDDWIHDWLTLFHQALNLEDILTDIPTVEKVQADIVKRELLAPDGEFDTDNAQEFKDCFFPRAGLLRKALTLIVAFVHNVELTQEIVAARREKLKEAQARNGIANVSAAIIQLESQGYKVTRLNQEPVNLHWLPTIRQLSPEETETLVSGRCPGCSKRLHTSGFHPGMLTCIERVTSLCHYYFPPLTFAKKEVRAQLLARRLE